MFKRPIRTDPYFEIVRPGFSSSVEELVDWFLENSKNLHDTYVLCNSTLVLRGWPTADEDKIIDRSAHFTACVCPMGNQSNPASQRRRIGTMIAGDYHLTVNKEQAHVWTGREWQIVETTPL